MFGPFKKASSAKKDFLVAVFEGEQVVLETTRQIHKEGVPIHDVYTPYPVHGIEDAMGIKRSKLPVVTFVMGLVGCLLAFGFQSWVLVDAWPINIGGKPFFASAAFIPVTFELTVLIGGLSTVAAFFIKQKMFPGVQPEKIGAHVTDHQFAIVIEKGKDGLNYSKVVQFLEKSGAVKIKE